jgi:hypothetical protein
MFMSRKQPEIDKMNRERGELLLFQCCSYPYISDGTLGHALELRLLNFSIELVHGFLKPVGDKA